jgi:hypothetical protein
MVGNLLGRSLSLYSGKTKLNMKRVPHIHPIKMAQQKELNWLSLFNMARCLLLEAKLPKMLWTYAVMASAYIRNRCFNDRLGKTPCI